MLHRQPLFDFQHPPGTYEQWLQHPTDQNSSCPVGVTHEHRFAFYFWGRWLHELAMQNRDHRPDLISIDWHRDLAPPSAKEKQALKELTTNDYNELSIFSWGYLNPHNDGHLLSAAYKNLIGDMYVLCKQKFTNQNYISDIHNNTHQIHVFKHTEELITHLPRLDTVFLDIDLDYFTETNSFMGLDPDVELVSDEKIREIINPHSELFRLVFDRLSGMTIALEPEFCGGYRNSSHLFNTVTEQLFAPPLLHPEADWNNS